MNQLIELRGIGRWSAEYVLLRGLGRLDVYPGDDVGARNNLKRWLNLRKPLDYEGVRRITKRWQPYVGLVYFHMLLDRLAASEGLAPGSGVNNRSGDTQVFLIHHCTNHKLWRKYMIRVKRVYEPIEKSDGARFLVDHLWPRGLKKEALQVERWIKLVSPSNALRSWFGHEPAKWKEFQRRYFAELNEQPETWEALLEAARERDITLVFSARDIEHNNAVALKSYLEKKLTRKVRSKSVKVAARLRKELYG